MEESAQSIPSEENGGDGRENGANELGDKGPNKNKFASETLLSKLDNCEKRKDALRLLMCPVEKNMKGSCVEAAEKKADAKANDKSF